jgi:hypothetical protein
MRTSLKLLKFSLRLVALAACGTLPCWLPAATAPRPSNTAPRNESVTTVKVRPSETDPAIKTFDTSHYVFVNEAILLKPDASLPADRRELLIWIPGTQNTESEGPGAAAAFCKVAANLGYHAIILKYPNDESASICRQDSDPLAFENFRMALIAGGASKHVTIGRAESIENRLLKLLGYLRKIRPEEHWEEFLNAEGDIKWAAIAVAGQSQGGGHAALIGIKHRVSRVICLGAPKDYSLALGRPAAWLTVESATPKASFFALNHQQDHQGCSPEQQMENLRALKLGAFGKPMDVDRAEPPYNQSRILTTNYPGGKLSSGEAHTMAINPHNEPVFRKVWAYMLTAPVP